MSFKELITDTTYFEKIIDGLTSEELLNIYNNIMSIKYILEFKDENLKKTYRKKTNNKGKTIICPCCNKKMTNLYFYQHKRTDIYKKYLESKKI